ncbi:IclR family transcriptional regulator [Tessaracoccus sp. Z1128]
MGLELFRKANGVLALLEKGGDWSAQEIAEATDEPVSSTYRMLTSLKEIGFVENGLTRGRFRLGLYAMTMGAVCDDRLSLRDTATPWLEWLQTNTTATSFLMLRRGVNAVCIDRVVGKGVRSLALRLGGSMPLYAGAGPRALLAFVADAERRAVLDHFEQESEVDPQVPTRRQLERTIEEIQAAGVSLSDEDVTPGIAAVGAPVFNHRGELVAAISVSTARMRLLQDRAKTVSLVLEAANEVSQAMGYRGGRESTT